MKTKKWLSATAFALLGAFAALSLSPVLADVTVLTYSTGGGVAVGGTNTWTGTNSFIDTTFTVHGSADATKKLRFEVDGFTTGVTRVVTFPNENGTVAILNSAAIQNWTGRQDFFNTNAAVIADGSRFILGSSVGDVTIQYNTTQTPDTFLVGLGQSGRSMVIVEDADYLFDFAHPLQTHPTLFIHSANQSTTQYLGLYHDATQGVLITGSGGVAFAPGGSNGFSVGVTASSVGVTSGWGLGFANGNSGGALDTYWTRKSAGVFQSNSSPTAITSLVGGGAAVASATALPLPTGRVFHVTGTTTITSITSTNFASGVVITLIFDGALTFTDGGNLVLAGNFVTTASDTITLVYDGTNWHETSRAIN